MKTRTPRRRLPGRLAATIGLVVLAASAASEPVDRDLLGDPEHKVVYQFNKADPRYMENVLFSVGEMLRKYGDNIHLVVTAIGPGVHLLARSPERPVPKILRQRASSLAMYGVEFHVCGNTLTSLGWTENDIEDFATIVKIGAEDLMLLQEQGYSYISW